MYIRKELEVTAETFLSNFALRCCLYFTWCNNLFMNNSKVCVLQEISLHIYHAIRLVRKQKLLGWYDVVHILWHVNLHYVLHNISQFSSPVSCRFMDGKVRENVEALFTLFSKYKLFVYGIEMWTKTARLIYFLFDLCGLKVAEHSFGSFWVYVICQIMARKKLQLTSWNFTSTDERF